VRPVSHGEGQRQHGGGDKPFHRERGEPAEHERGGPGGGQVRLSQRAAVDLLSDPAAAAQRRPAATVSANRAGRVSASTGSTRCPPPMKNWIIR